MIKVLFAAHDPGGADAIIPVYREWRKQAGTLCRLILSGPAAENRPEYRVEKQAFVQAVSDYFFDMGGILVTGTSWNDDSELLAIRECKRKGIRTVAILDFWSNYASRFCLSGGERVYPHDLFVMDETAKAEAQEEGVHPDRIWVAGQPGLDAYIHAQVRPAGDRKRVLFLSQPLSELYGKQLGYTEFDTTEDVLAVCRELGFLTDIKFHPKETEKYRQAYASCEAEGDWKELLSRCGIVIGMNTMGLLQCALMGACVISYQPGLCGKDLCITNRLGITQGAFSLEELKRRLESRESFAFPDKKKWLWADGKSTKRCVNLLQNIRSDMEGCCDVFS